MQHLQLRKRHLAITATMLCLTAFPKPALANNTVGRGIGEAIETLAKIIGGMALTSLLLGIMNYQSQRTWVKVLAVLLLLPATIVALVLAFAFPVAGIPAAAVIAGIYWLTFKRPAEQWSGNEDEDTLQ